MGCGKSSVGRRLSELLCCPFMDLDSVIEEQAGRSIAEIFTSDGEAEFRRMELEALRSIIQAGTASERVPKQSLPSSMGPSLCGQRGSTVSEPSLMPRHCIVLALGGGAVMTPECAELVKENTLCIYLRTSVDTLVERLTDEAAGRPLLNTGNQPSNVIPSTNTNVIPSTNTNVIPSTNTNVIPSEVEESTLRHRIETLMTRRTSTYEATAHHIIDTDGISVDELAHSIISVINR